MIDVQPPPTSGNGTGWVPWISSIVIAVGAALWAALRAKDAKLIGALEARISEQDKVIAAKDATITKLGEKLDKQREDSAAALAEQQQGRIEDAKRTARVLLQMQLQRGAQERPREWEEAPTGVRDFLEIYEAGADARRDPTDPPPRRPRLPR